MWGSGKSSYSSRTSDRDSSNELCLLMSICFEICGFPSGYAVTLIQKSQLKVHFMHVLTTVRLSFPEVMVHRQFSGICWHSSSMSSQFGGILSEFCGIYSVLKFNIIKKITQRITIVDSNFRSSVAKNFFQFKNC